MPSGSCRPVLLPSAGWLSSVLSGELPRWEFCGGVVEAESPLNNGRSGHLWILRCGAQKLALTSHGGLRRKRIAAFFCRSEDVAVRLTMGSSGRTLRWPELFFIVVELLWLESEKTVEAAAGASVNKASGLLFFVSAELLPLLPAGRGGEGEKGEFWQGSRVEGAWGWSSAVCRHSTMASASGLSAELPWWAAHCGAHSDGHYKPGVVQVCQDQNRHPLHDCSVQEDHHFRSELLPSAAAPRESRSGFLSSRNAEIQTCCNTKDQLRIAVQVVLAIFKPLGCIRRRQMRSSPKSLPRFSGEDFLDLSSVMRTQNVQLQCLPRLPMPTRLLVEPLALRLVRLCEAPEEHNCRIVVSVLSTDPLVGSDCVLLLRRLVLPVVLLLCVLVGTRFSSDLQSISCMSFAVP